MVSVDCEVSKKVDRKVNKAVGKSKKGGQNLEPTSVLCYLKVRREDRTWNLPQYSAIWRYEGRTEPGTYLSTLLSEGKKGGQNLEPTSVLCYLEV